jgi:tetratricopeptide (TPR) repeat protein
MDNVNDINFSVSRFEKMVKENKVLFFDSAEFENIISYYLDIGKLSNAKKALNLSLSQHPSSTNLKLFHIEILIQEDQFIEAIDIIDSILLIEASNFEAIILKSNILSKQKKHNESIILIKSILEDYDNKKELYYQVGIEYLFLEDYKMANEFFKKSLKFDFMDHSALYNILYCYETDKNLNGVIKFLQGYLSKNPYSEIGWYNLGKNYVKIKDYEKALAAFDYSIFSDDSFTSPYIDKGKLLEKIKKYEQAIENYKEIISINPNSSYALFRIGFCYEKIKDYNKSLTFYYKCISDDPNMDKAFYRISMYYYRENNFKKATEYIEKAIGSNQEKSKYWKIYLNCLSKTSTKNY